MLHTGCRYRNHQRRKAMNDTEKVKLIGKIIGDFWEYSSDDEINAGAATLVVAINTVVEFKSEKP